MNNTPILLHGGQCRPVVTMNMKRAECPQCAFKVYGMTAEAVFLAISDHWGHERHLQSTIAAGDTQGDA